MSLKPWLGFSISFLNSGPHENRRRRRRHHGSFFIVPALETRRISYSLRTESTAGGAGHFFSNRRSLARKIFPSHFSLRYGHSKNSGRSRIRERYFLESDLDGV